MVRLKNKSAVKWRLSIIHWFTAYTVHSRANILNGVVASSPRNESVLHVVMEAGSFVTVAPKYLDTATFSKPFNNYLRIMIPRTYSAAWEKRDRKIHTFFLWVYATSTARFSKWTRFPLTLRWLISYIYGAPILDVSRSHTTTQHSR